jgi:ketosteroid isomerase-like protein
VEIQGMRNPMFVRFVRVLLAPAALLALAACTQLVAPSRQTDGEIARQRQEFNQLVAYRRMADLAGLVTDDVQLITPARAISGKKNLVRGYETLVQKRPDLLSTFTTERVERNPRWKFAAESGHWLESWQQDGESIEIHGTYHALWKLKDGRWRIQSQIVTPLSCKGARYCKALEF